MSLDNYYKKNTCDVVIETTSIYFFNLINLLMLLFANLVNLQLVLFVKLSDFMEIVLHSTNHRSDIECNKNVCQPNWTEPFSNDH